MSRLMWLMTPCRELKIDGVEPTEEEILAGKYMLERPFVMATKGEISGQNELVQAWFNYINSMMVRKLSNKLDLLFHSKGYT